MVVVTSTRLAVSAVVLTVLYATWNYYQKLRRVNFLPGVRIPFSPISAAGFLLPTGKLNPSGLLTWMYRDTLYEEHGSDIISIVPYLGGPALFYTRSAEAVKQVFGNKTGFEKMYISVEMFKTFGENVLASYWDQWSRHRRIVSPGFNQVLYAQVWRETSRTYDDMLSSSGWETVPFFIMPDVTSMGSKFALHLIASCGFGLPLAWSGEGSPLLGKYTLYDCFRIASQDAVALGLVPEWVFNLPIEKLQRGREVTRLLGKYLQGIISERRQEGFTEEQMENKRNVFQLLLKANDEEKDSKLTLTDRELISNVFLLMLAGHETTGRALGATLGLLACHPKEQETAYQEVMSVLNGETAKDPTFNDYDVLPFVAGCFTEGLRLFPSILLTLRTPIEDLILRVPSPGGGDDLRVPIRKGDMVILDFVGYSYNPRRYASPDSFIPSRWLSPDVEPLATFGSGPRVCVGRKFAYTESVCLLALILRDWRLEPILHEGEDLAKWRERVLNSTMKVELGSGPSPFPLKWTRRQ